MARRTLHGGERLVVEWDEENRLKPTADATCYRVGNRAIRVDADGLRTWWFADEGVDWNDLLRWADEDDA